jgi:two-component system cell cycle sensor histidine kinase PleC
MAEEAPPLQPESFDSVVADDKRRPRNKPIMSAGTGL